jgi:serine/threonine protein kinase
MEVSFADLEMGRNIGQGACSAVNIARHKRTGQTYAVKMFNVDDQNQASQLSKEILLLATVRCASLITLKGAFHDQGSIGIIIEYMDKGSLEFLMDTHINLPERVMAAVVFQMIWGALQLILFSGAVVVQQSPSMDFLF